MMRSQRGRRATPLFALLAFEIVAIIVLQAAGSAESMHIPWSNFWTWMNTASVDELAMPMLRYAALGIAYWMLVSTLLFILAQVSRMPNLLRVTSMFTLPAVRRAVDGAMAVSIATTSLVGFGGAAMAADDPFVTSTPPTSDLTTTTAGSGDLSLATPDLGDLASSVTTEVTPVESVTTTTADTADTVLSSEQATTSFAPSAGDDSVPTPSPGAPDTTVPQGPSTTTTVPPTTTPAPTPAPTQPEVLGEQEHRVVPGDNLWTISRDAIASATNRSGSQVSEAEIRDYWLKVIEANRDSIRSKDPHWIFPGEIIKLPALDTSHTGS